MNIETLSNGSRLVIRYRRGFCFACVWAPDTTDRQIQSSMAQGEAAFFPYDEATGQFLWGSSRSNRALYFRK